MPPRSRIALTSPPDEKAVPAPVTIATEMSVSRCTRPIAPTKASIVAGEETGLRRSGSFSVIVATRPAVSYRTRSVDMKRLAIERKSKDVAVVPSRRAAAAAALRNRPGDAGRRRNDA